MSNITLGILIAGGIGLLGCGFMLYRNMWVYRHRMEWAENVADFTTHLVATGKYSSSYHQRCYDAIEDYDTMVWRFWLWDLEDFVLDYETYYEVVDHQCKLIMAT